MKILDRYLMRAYLGPLFICLTTFTMLFVVQDLFNNLSDFLEGQTSWLRVALFYLALIPTGLILIAPISLLLSLLYCLSRLTRNNELTAVRACGISTPRLMLPFMAVGAAAALITGAVNETLSPWAAWWTKQFVRAQRSADDASVYVHLTLPYRNHPAHRSWLIGRFDTRTREMRGVEVVQSDAQGRDLFKISADSAHWMGGRWWFRDAIYQEFDANNDRRGPPRWEPAIEMANWDETPRLFLEEIRDRDYRSALGLIKFLRNNRGISPEEAARIRVDIHSRIALPFSCLLVTLIGIPFGYHTGRKGALIGVLLAILLFFAYYFLIHFSVWLGKKGLIAPWLAGWMPNLLVLGVGGGLLRRIR